MSVFVFSNSKRGFFLYFLVTISVVSVTFSTLNLIFHRSSFELINTWFKSELIYIQQGQTLSSVNKLQGFIRDSSLLQGIKIVESKSGKELLRYGSQFEINSEKLSKISTEISFIEKGVFSNKIGIQIENQYIIFLSSSNEFKAVSLFLILFTLFSLGFVFYFAKLQTKFREQLSQEMLRNKLKLEADNNLYISDLSAQFVHDIKSPLSLINSVAYVISQNHPEESKMLNYITKQIVVGIDDTLNRRKRFYESKLNGLKSDFNTKEFIDKIETLIKGKSIEFRDSKFKIEVLLDIKMDKLIKGDLNLLLRVISNLLNNSIESQDSFKQITIHINFQNSKLIMILEDDGPGIPKSLIDKVMVGPILSTKPNGNGIGLSSAIKDIEQMGGVLQITSEVDRGTRIEISLQEI